MPRDPLADWSPQDAPPTVAALVALLDGTHLAATEELPTVVTAAGRPLGCDLTLHLVDFSQRNLVPFLPPGAPEQPPLPIEGTLAGRAFRDVETLAAEGEACLWMPLLDGVERVGVLEVRRTDPDVDLAAPVLRQQLTWVGRLAGHLVAVMTPYGDVITRLRGGAARTVAAELIWNLLPPLTYACEGLVVSGILEPSDAVAGDVFDYAVDDGTAHVAILDATGHNLRSGLLSAVSLAAYRTSRRQRRGLFDTARAVDELLADQTGGEGYATGLLAQLDLASGRLRYLNAGHPSPLLMRHGKVVKALEGGRRSLLGLDRAAATVAEEWLEPGDRLVFYTDGITEARDEQGRFFGTERLTDLLERSALAGAPAPETLRRVVHDVLDHQRGVLQDDATLVMVEWATSAEHRLYPI